MGKGIAYLLLTVIGAAMLWGVGAFDSLSTRGRNLDERTAWWQETLARQAPAGTARGAVDALLAEHGIVLDCFSPSATADTQQCQADDPQAHGGTANHPVTVELTFVFEHARLQQSEVGLRMLK